MRWGTHKLGYFFRTGTLCILGALFFAYTPTLLAEELTDTDAANEKAKAALVQRFLEFTGDKNVMGKANTTDGKVVKTGSKSRFDKDDGLSYKSDLTYHDFAFKTPDKSAEKKDPNDPNAKTRMLEAFISEHGGLSEAGGSSQLERTVYQEHERKSKEQEKDPEKIEKMEEEKGVKYISIFQINTQEVFEDGQGGNAGAGGAGSGGSAGSGSGSGGKKEKDKVERREIVEDVREKIEQVGKESFQTIERSARDKENQDDETTMGNPILLYEAGARAAEAWWNSTLANLGQRRTAREVRRGSFGDNVELSEEAATCDDWAASAQKNLDKIQDANAKKAEQEEIQKAVDKCKKMAQQKFNAIDPRFEDEEGKELPDPQAQGEKKEDPFARDMRNQLEVLEKAGKSATKLKSNWKYEAKDDKAKVVREFDEQGNALGEVEQTVAEQLQDYNAQLDDAAKGFKEVKERFPQLQVNEEEIGQYKIEPETQSARDIMLRPVQQDIEEITGKPTGYSEEAETYDELVQKQQGE